ncbi:hypothetical protein ACQQ67_11375 [Corynebacterium diphtheriae]
MFKRSLASVAAVAIASGVIVAPANALTVKVSYDGSCTFFLTAEEASYTSLTQTVTLKKEKAADLKATLVKNQLSALEADIAKYEKELANLELDEEQKKDLKRRLEEKKKRFTANQNFKKALEACDAGHDYDSKQPGGSDQPGGSNKPDGSDQPGDSNKPDVKPAPPSTDGAGIGAIVAGSIVAILGILAVALPFIKSMLPAQLRALLP